MHTSKPNLKVLLPEETIEVENHSKNCWYEFKIKQNIPPRSYHTSVIYNSTLYVYGGYEPNTGILSDFYSFSLSKDSENEFKPESRNGTYPGISKNFYPISLFLYFRFTTQTFCNLL